MKTTPSDCALRGLFCSVTCLRLAVRRFKPILFFPHPVCDMTLDLDSDYRCLSVLAIPLSLDRWSSPGTLHFLSIQVPNKARVITWSEIKQSLPPSATFSSVLTSFFCHLSFSPPSGCNTKSMLKKIYIYSEWRSCPQPLLVLGFMGESTYTNTHTHQHSADFPWLRPILTCATEPTSYGLCSLWSRTLNHNHKLCGNRKKEKL